MWTRQDGLFCLGRDPVPPGEFTTISFSTQPYSTLFMSMLYLQVASRPSVGSPKALTMLCWVSYYLQVRIWCCQGPTGGSFSVQTHLFLDAQYRLIDGVTVVLVILIIGIMVSSLIATVLSNS